MPNTMKPPATCRKDPHVERARALAVVLLEEFGVPFRIFDAPTGDPIGTSDFESAQGLPSVSRAEVVRLSNQARAEVVPSEDHSLQIRLPVSEPNYPSLVAIGVLPALARTPAEADQERSRLGKWAQAFVDRLRLATSRPLRPRRADDAERAPARAWEALLGLEHLLQGQRLHREPDKNRRRILKAAAGLLGASSVVWAPTRGRGEALVEGEPILSSWDCGQLADLLTLEPTWRGPGYLICNEVPPDLGRRFTRIDNLLAVPLPDVEPQGWVIALNGRTEEPAVVGSPADAATRAETGPFRRMDVALLSPFAALLGLSLRSYERYQSLKELLVGLTRSLTAAIDAKDAYTAGHSERVARIAVVVGQEMSLRGEELSDIYLAGLLHDIGKIGIRDAVLGKREPLTEEEFDHIRQHPVIGHRILAGLRPIDHLLPGVLYHHERHDGKGYPEGLSGDMIPLLARILSVADSYDAMSTSRPYRMALSTAVIEQRLQEGADVQWDRRVIDAFTRCRSKVHAVRHRGVGESLRGALDDAMRYQDSARID